MAKIRLKAEPESCALQISSLRQEISTPILFSKTGIFIFEPRIHECIVLVCCFVVLVEIFDFELMGVFLDNPSFNNYNYNVERNDRL